MGIKNPDESSKPKIDLWIVGIGASAGGLEALTQFVSGLPTDSNACYVVAQHLAPHAKSLMVELIAKHCPISVDVVSSETQIVANKLYIVPPNHDVELRDQKLILTRAGEETRPKPSVDRFFVSIARDFGQKAIGVILSGTGSDGTEGIRAIKNSGGITFAQEESSAKFTGMPSSAFETGQVDFVLKPTEIAKKLGQIVNNEGASFSQEPADEDPVFQKIISLIRTELGSDFSQYKLPTLKRRLVKRMFAIDSENLEAYYNFVKDNAVELRSLAQDFLVSVTSFFRDRDAFAALESVVKLIIENKSDHREIRVWSAGCASGEEAYSLAMLFTDYIAKSKKQISLKVFATDLDTDAISKARIGFYHERDLGNVSPEYLDSYFEPRGDYYEVKKSIRDQVVFARQNLIQSPPFVKLDLIACRNVMIYFEPDLQQKIFEIFNYALKPDSYLFIGRSEALTGVSELFETIDKKAKIFRKKQSLQKSIPSLAHVSHHNVQAPPPRKRISQSTYSPVQVAQTQMLERHGISGAIVDGDGTIQSIIGDVSNILKLREGVDSLNLQGLLPRSASVEFQLLLRKSDKNKGLETSRAFNLAAKSEPVQLFQISCSPLDSREDSSLLSPALFLVTFERVKNESAQVHSPSSNEGNLAIRAAELEQELAATKEHLQTVIEELGVTNEELQSTNEELSSTNEELQSSNEELETTNEEFQSTNEELTTLNEEINLKSLELRNLNTDLENIQVSIGLPLLVVDEELHLQRYNPAVTELFDISYNDIGRLLSRLSCRCEIDSFSDKVKQVIQTGEISNSTIEAYRSVYQMRITPRRADDKKIVGAVIMFYNNTQLILAEQRLRKSESRIRAIIDGTSAIIFQKNMSGKYIAVNRAFLDYFDLTEEEVVDKSDREIFSDEFSNQLRNGELEAVLKRTRIETKEDFAAKSRSGTFLVSRFPLSDDAGSTPYAVVTVAADITQQISAQTALKKSEALYRGVVEDQSVFVVRYNPEGIITFANAAFVRYFGGQNLGYIGYPFSSIIDPVDRNYVTGEIARLSEQKPIVQLEHRFSRYENNARWIRWINKAVLNNDNQVVEIQAVGFDVTEYRQQTDQMVQREILFSNIFTYTTDFLTVYRVTSEQELLLESFNRSVDDNGGFTYAQFLGRNVRELVTSPHREEILAKYQACVKNQAPQQFDEEISVQGSIRYLSTTLIPVVNNAGKVERVATLSRDVSKYKIAEAELSAAKAAAEIANESKSDFLASMSHELRSPLNVVIGMAGLLEEAALEQQEREQVKSILRSGKVLLALIEDILDLSKIEAGKTKLEFNNFSVVELVTEVIETFKQQVDAKGIRLNVQFTMDDHKFYVGDMNRIRQILINLIGNAVKFTEQGSVDLSISSVGHKTTGRRLVRFEIKDTGIGIPEDYHSRIFKKFSQVDSGLGRKFGGTGLGLVICQRLTTLMHGQIGFTSEWNKGSTFWFEIPLTIAKEAKEKVQVKNEKLKAAPITANILAVDDSPDGRMLLDMLMKRLGHKCEIVSGGEAAIEAVKNKSYDLILMDVQMPGLDGYQTTSMIRKLKHKNNNIPIIALTANAMVGDSEKCFDSGMNDYVTKPINVDTLRASIARWATHSGQRKSVTPLRQGDGTDVPTAK